MSSHSLIEELKDAIDAATIMTEEKMNEDPRSSLFFFAKTQLDDINQMLTSPDTIMNDTIKHIQIGRMATREFNQNQMDYINALCMVSFLVKKLANMIGFCTGIYG